VARFVGELGFVLGLTALVPLLAALCLGEHRLLLPYGFVAAILIAVGTVARRAPAPRDLQTNEALVISAAAFVLGPSIMTVPLVWQGIPWLDALFEAVSGFTTTGLSTLDALEARPRTFLLARAWMQWVGGLGFVSLSLALVLGPGLVTRRLGSPSFDPGDVVGSMRAHARRTLTIYLGLTGLGVVVLLLLGAGPFDAFVHTFAGVSTGGFAPRDASLAALGRPLQGGILLISLLGAVTLTLYGDLRRGRWRRLRDDPETRAVLLLIALFGLGVAGSAWRWMQAHGASLADLVLLTVSAQSTTGFATFAIDGLPATTKVLLVASMLIGGSVGSTAGGVKLMRLLMMVHLLRWLVVRTRLPAHAVSRPRMAGQPLEAEDLSHASALIFLFGVVLVAAWLPFLACGYAPLDALFEVASAVGTVGLSVGITRPELEPALKGVLCMAMLLGRLEIFAILVALAPRTWIGRS
jgi:trk system potassium uptake protein TrkH